MDFTISLLGLQEEQNLVLTGALLMRMPQIVAECLYATGPKPHYQVMVSTNGAAEPTIVLTLDHAHPEQGALLSLVENRIVELFTTVTQHTPRFEVRMSPRQGVATTP